MDRSTNPIVQYWIPLSKRVKFKLQAVEFVLEQESGCKLSWRLRRQNKHWSQAWHLEGEGELYGALKLEAAVGDYTVTEHDRLEIAQKRLDALILDVMTSTRPDVEAEDASTPEDAAPVPPSGLGSAQPVPSTEETQSTAASPDVVISRSTMIHRRTWSATYSFPSPLGSTGRLSIDLI